jgi:hypothetical protein
LTLDVEGRIDIVELSKADIVENWSDFRADIAIGDQRRRRLWGEMTTGK